MPPSQRAPRVPISYQRSNPLVKSTRCQNPGLLLPRKWWLPSESKRRPGRGLLGAYCPSRFAPKCVPRNPKLANPKPEPRNPKPETRNTKHETHMNETRNTKHETRNMQTRNTHTRDTQHETRKPGTRDPRPETRDPKPTKLGGGRGGSRGPRWIDTRFVLRVVTTSVQSDIKSSFFNALV